MIMKLKDILGIKEIHSTGKCEALHKGDCDKCNWKLQYVTPSISNQNTQFYECITDCGYISHMIVRKEVISYD